MAKDMYIVSFLIPIFQTLEEAKLNVKFCLSRSEAKRLLRFADEAIFHFIGDNLVSKTPIYVDSYGNITFGKTRKFNKVVRVI